MKPLDVVTRHCKYCGRKVVRVTNPRDDPEETDLWLWVHKHNELRHCLPASIRRHFGGGVWKAKKADPREDFLA